MKVSDLKRLLESAPDDADVLVGTGDTWKNTNTDAMWELTNGLVTTTVGEFDPLESTVYLFGAVT